MIYPKIMFPKGDKKRITADFFLYTLLKHTTLKAEKQDFHFTQMHVML